MAHNKNPQQVSQVIGQIEIPGIPQRPRRPSFYDVLKKDQPNHHLVTEYDAKFKEWQDYWDNMPKPEVKVVEPPKLKKLVEVDVKSVYHAFWKKYFEVTGDYFNHEANNGESLVLVYTLIYYLFRNPKFIESPILNKTINEPSLTKGLLVFGGFGCGKTSIFKTFKKLFFDADKTHDIMVKDIEGDEVHLHRYRRGFGYFSTNEVVENYEACSNEEMKGRFWHVHNRGMLYYDDLMTERQASNYGKVELFKDILEKRYEKGLYTMASLNYHIDTSGQTLDTTQTMLAMAAKYGNRVYDRLFGMFNIIELQGKSLRK